MSERDYLIRCEAARLAREGFIPLVIGLGTWNMNQSEEVAQGILQHAESLAKLLAAEAINRIGFELPAGKTTVVS